MVVAHAVLLALMLVGLAPALAQQGTPPSSAATSIPFPTATATGSSCSAIRSATDCGPASIAPSRTTPRWSSSSAPRRRPGFARTNSYDWNAELADLLKKDTYQIAIVMFGDNDAQPIKSGKDWLKVGSDGWREIYGQRVEAFIKKLRAANIAVYWVGLPIMRSPGQNADAEALNDVFREKAFINGAKFIETWNGFTDEAGRYSAYGPDMTGQVKRLRADDGVHFTMRGYLKLAHFVEKELRRDLNLAKIERNIPLAGNEEEQAKVMGRDVVPGRSDPQRSEPPTTEQTEAAADASSAPEHGARRASSRASAKQCRRRERGQAGDRPDAPGGARPDPASGLRPCPKPR